MELYEKQRNHVLSMLHASKQTFLDKLGSADVKEFLKLLSSTKKTAIPATLMDGTTTAESSHSKATLLNAPLLTMGNTRAWAN